MSIRAIIFDMNGVIVHAKNHDKRHAWEKRLGLGADELTDLVFHTPAAAHAASGQVAECDVWKQVGEKLGLPNDQIAELQSDFWASEELDTAMAQFIQGLRPQYKTALLSNAWSDARKFHNSRFKLNEWMDVAVYSAEVKLLKPDARIYQLAVSLLDVRADECIFVDDMFVNIQAAQSLGMKGVLCQDTAQTIRDIKSFLDHGKA